MPFVWRVHAQPAEADGIGDDGEDDEDVWSPGAKVGEAAEHEEDGNLDGKGDAVAQENDAVDGALLADERKLLTIAGSLVEEILEGCWGEIWYLSEKGLMGDWRVEVAY